MGKGQQPGFSFEQPTHGYSRTPPPFIVTMAICGVVHDPFSSKPPANVAMGPPPVVVKAGTISVTVDTVPRVNELMVVAPVVGCAVVRPAILVLVLDGAVVSRGEHPRKSGMLTL